MIADPQQRDEPPIENAIGEPEIPQDMEPQRPPTPEDELSQIFIDKARRLVAAELDLAQMRGQLLENNLQITEAQLELAERQLDQLIAENQQLRKENESLKRRLGESA